MIPIINILSSDWGLIGYFLGIFISYSIIPLPSDAAILVAGALYNPIFLFVITFISATLGSITSYYIGLKGLRLFVKRKINPKKELLAERIFQKWGPLSLFLLFCQKMLFLPHHTYQLIKKIYLNVDQS